MEREAIGDELAVHRQSVRIRLAPEDQAVGVVDVFFGRAIIQPIPFSAGRRYRRKLTSYGSVNALKT